MKPPTIKCVNCNRIHFAVTEEYAIEQTQCFIAYYNKLTPEQQKDLYGNRKPTITDYQTCCCKGTKFEIYNGPTPNFTIGPKIYAHPQAYTTLL